MSKEVAPNFREVQACNNCKFNVDYYTEKGGSGTYVGCMKYEGTEDSCYNQYVCDGYMDMGAPNEPDQKTKIQNNKEAKGED